MTYKVFNLIIYLMSLSKAPLEIWQSIFDSLDFVSQFNLRRIDSELYYNIRIINLFSVPTKYLDKLSDKELQQPQFRYVKYLDASFNLNITNKSIINLPLEKLDISWNDTITDDVIVKLHNLKILIAQGLVGISDAGISQLTSLDYLDICISNKLTNSITNKSLQNLTLKKLRAKYNNCVTLDGVLHMSGVEYITSHSNGLVQLYLDIGMDKFKYVEFKDETAKFIIN